ncbi:hypothetical protein LX36DRAFT_42661 [Colletotrichum falcatum]|nr:hypothetical protein LX36DRAFT_42661 [Colletotrichum falcatum]
MASSQTDHKAYDAIALHHSLEVGESAAALKKTVQELQRIIRGHIRDIARSSAEVANAAAKAEQARGLVLEEELRAAEAQADKAEREVAKAMMMAEANNQQAIEFASRYQAAAGAVDVNQQQQQPAASQGRRRRRYRRDLNRIPKRGYTLHCIRCGIRRSRNDELRRHLREKHYPALFPEFDRPALLAQARLEAP